MSKKRILQMAGFVFGGILIGLLLTNVLACEMNLDDDPNGGAGADFDESLYYTKTEIDSLFSAYSTAIEVNGLVEEVVQNATTEATQSITVVGWAGKTDGWSSPEGATSALFKIVLSGGTVDPNKALYITVSATNTGSPSIISQFSVEDTGGFTSFFGYATFPAGSDVYAWHDSDTGHAGAVTNLSGISVTVQPVVWFK